MADREEEVRAQRPIRVLKERVGGTRPEVAERSKRHRRLMKAIRTALAGRSLTVPELAAAVDSPSHEVLWMLMAMKKYGEISEGEERDGYFEYALIAAEAGR